MIESSVSPEDYAAFQQPYYGAIAGDGLFASQATNDIER